MVGPLSIGENRFVIEANAPNPALIANSDLLGSSVVFITGSYKLAHFVRIAYYLNLEYSEPIEPGTFPNPVDVSKLIRTIVDRSPIVTTFAIDWSGAAAAADVAGEMHAQADEEQQVRFRMYDYDVTNIYVAVRLFLFLTVLFSSIFLNDTQKLDVLGGGAVTAVANAAEENKVSCVYVHLL